MLSWVYVLVTSKEAKPLGLFGLTHAAIALVPIALGLLRLRLRAPIAPAWCCSR